MKIGLLDGSKKVRRYPFGLMKLSTYHKSIGNDVVFLGNSPPYETFDQIWISAIFTYDIPHVKKMVNRCTLFAKEIVIGGISPTLMPEEFEGYNVHTGIFEPAQNLSPDYSILEEIPKYSITQTSYGCIRNCKFCAVKKLEPEFTIREDWEKDVHPLTKKLCIYDNNWTAKSESHKESDIEKIKAMNHIKQIDFNQALDCRIFTEHDAYLIGQIRVKPLRFSFDGMHEDGFLQESIKMAIKYGTKLISTYMLYNFTDTPQDLYYRMREIAQLQEMLWPSTPGLVLTVFPMMYQPIYDIDSQRYVGKYYTQKIIRNIKITTATIGFGGGFTWLHGVKQTPMRNFEYFMGKNEIEFINLMNSDNIIETIKYKLNSAKI